MIVSLSLALALTALFAVTGGYALWRWSSAVAALLSPARRLAELAHLLMSAAMLVMNWTWYGTAGLWVQLVLFGGFAVWFAGDAARRRRRRVHGCAGGSAHALMAAAMVWMLAAMPLIMATPVAAAGGGGHEGHGGHPGGTGDLAGTSHGGPAGWAVVVTVLLCAALLATAGFWAVRALARSTRGHEFDTDVPGVPLGPTDGAGPTSGAGSATAVTERPTSRPATRLGARADAGCHALMSIGMVGMLAAMVGGW